MPVILALEQWKQEIQEFKTSLEKTEVESEKINETDQMN